MPHRAFEEVVLPHLDAAFNYARWLTKSDADAEDVVQDAAVRALRFFSSLRNDDARAWLLTIVRNTWYARFSKAGRADQHAVFDDMKDERPDEQLDPEALVIQQQAVERVQRAHRRAAGRFPRGRRAARARGIVVQGDRRRDRNADRHGDVAAGAGPRAAAGGAGSGVPDGRCR